MSCERFLVKVCGMSRKKFLALVHIKTGIVFGVLTVYDKVDIIGACSKCAQREVLHLRKMVLVCSKRVDVRILRMNVSPCAIWWSLLCVFSCIVFLAYPLRDVGRSTSGFGVSRPGLRSRYYILL